jgi:uncharacterized membrane protein YczE
LARPRGLNAERGSYIRAIPDKPASNTSVLRRVLRPHRTIPEVTWTASSRWDLAPLRVSVLLIGLAMFGLGDALIIQSRLGNAPWSVLAQGLSLHTPFTIGECTLLVGVVILALWWPLRERPGFGTISNIIVLSVFIDVGLSAFPSVHGNLTVAVAYLLVGVAVVGAGSALYLTTGLGPGPRDGLMAAVHERTGVRVARVRLAIEVTALTVGWFLGGRLGVGTVVFAVLIGYSLAVSLSVVGHLAPARSRS